MKFLVILAIVGSAAAQFVNRPLPSSNIKYGQKALIDGPTYSSSGIGAYQYSSPSRTVNFNLGSTVAKTYSAPLSTVNYAAPAAYSGIHYPAPTTYGAPATFGSVNYAAPATFGTVSHAAPAAFGTLKKAAPAAYGNVNYAAPAAFGTVNHAAPASAYYSPVHHSVSAPRPVQYSAPAQYNHGAYTNSVAKPYIAILHQTQDVSHDGSYNYGFDSQDGISVQASGSVKALGPEEQAQVATGSYSYTAPDGTPIVATWYADETGFHVQGDHIPKDSRTA